MKAQKKQTVVLGNFDGVHLGHQQLLAMGRQIANGMGEELTVFTFYPQIQTVLQPDFAYLLTEKEKEQRFKAIGVDHIVTIPFDENISHMSPEQFVTEILVEKLHASHVVVGFNYTFGYRGSGNTDLLIELCEQHQIVVAVMDAYQLHEEIISSTAVRQALKQGNINYANEMLGYYYHLCGQVVHGNEIGRTIGFPTANLALQDNLFIPGNGVYAVKVDIQGEAYRGILNIGVRPTVDKNLAQTIEVHILDFDKDIYGESICVEFIQFLRSETKFADLEELKVQLMQDKEKTKQLFYK